MKTRFTANHRPSSEQWNSVASWSSLTMTGENVPTLLSLTTIEPVVVEYTLDR